jgi:hypothetical protein
MLAVGRSHVSQLVRGGLGRVQLSMYKSHMRIHLRSVHGCLGVPPARPLATSPPLADPQVAAAADLRRLARLVTPLLPPRPVHSEPAPAPMITQLGPNVRKALNFNAAATAAAGEGARCSTLLIVFIAAIPLHELHCCTVRSLERNVCSGRVGQLTHTISNMVTGEREWSVLLASWQASA